MSISMPSSQSVPITLPTKRVKDNVVNFEVYITNKNHLYKNENIQSIIHDEKIVRALVEDKRINKTFEFIGIINTFTDREKFLALFDHNDPDNEYKNKSYYVGESEWFKVVILDTLF